MEFDTHSGQDKSSFGPARTEDEGKLSARRLQNRVSQREFRSRKQAHIKSLEAKLSVLSVSKSDTIDNIRSTLQLFKSENRKLRSLIGEITKFVSTNPNHLNQVLSHFGLTPETLKELLNKNESIAGLEAWESSSTRFDSKSDSEKKSEDLPTPNSSPTFPHLPEHLEHHLQDDHSSNYQTYHPPSNYNTQPLHGEVPSHLFSIEQRPASQLIPHFQRFKSQESIHAIESNQRTQTQERPVTRSWPTVDASGSGELMEWNGIGWNSGYI